MTRVQDSLVEGEPRYNVVGNQHRNHQAVNGYNTRHDDRDDGLHDELWPHYGHGSNACTTLGCAISCAQGWWGRETNRYTGGQVGERNPDSQYIKQVLKQCLFLFLLKTQHCSTYQFCLQGGEITACQQVMITMETVEVKHLQSC